MSKLHLFIASLLLPALVFSATSGPALIDAATGKILSSQAPSTTPSFYGFDPALHAYTTGQMTNWSGSISPGIFFFVTQTGLSCTGAKVAILDTSNRTIKVSLWDDNANTRITKSFSHTGNAAVQLYTVTFDSSQALTMGKRYILAAWDDSGTKYSTLNAATTNNYWPTPLATSEYVFSQAGVVLNGGYYGNGDTKPGTGNAQTTGPGALTPIVQ